jgi:hypothetical protein
LKDSETSARPEPTFLLSDVSQGAPDMANHLMLKVGEYGVAGKTDFPA